MYKIVQVLFFWFRSEFYNHIVMESWHTIESTYLGTVNKGHDHNIQTSSALTPGDIETSFQLFAIPYIERGKLNILWFSQNDPNFSLNTYIDLNKIT